MGGKLRKESCKSESSPGHTAKQCLQTKKDRSTKAAVTKLGDSQLWPTDAVLVMFCGNNKISGPKEEGVDFGLHFQRDSP